MKWIKVTKQEPPVNTSFIGELKNGFVGEMYYGYSGALRPVNSKDEIKIELIAWMPMPIGTLNE